MTSTYYNCQVLLIKLQRAYLFKPSDLEKITEELSVQYKNLSSAEREVIETLAHDLAIIDFPELDQTQDLAVQVHKLKQEVQEYRSSFDLYAKATQALQELYPHPNKLTHRDIADLCSMAVSEINKFRNYEG